MSGLFVCFLLVAAIQDFRHQSVEVRVYGVFGILTLLMLAYYGLSEGEFIDIWDLCGGVGVGVGLLGGSILWRKSIGVGDGCFFLISGLMLGFWKNLALFCYGLLLCSSYCLILFIWNLVWHQKNIKNFFVPFLPFLVPFGIWIALLP